MIPKPVECTGCVLEKKGAGFAPPYGNPQSPIVVIAEALGKEEAWVGEPLVGQAGVYWQRALARLGIQKSSLYVGNTVNCQPPNNWLASAPWERSAINHCHIHRRKFYTAHAKVYLTMGVTATRTVLKEVLNVDYQGEMENWHGYVIGKRPDGPFVVPTYHPSYLLQGNHDLFGAFLYDTKRAMEAASFGVYAEPTPQLIIDPPPSYFADYVEQIPDDPDAWLAVDTETGEANSSGNCNIIRVNLCMHPDQAITVPYEERYRFALQRALTSNVTKLFWYERFDLGEFAKPGGLQVKGETLDCMWAWHMLQSGLPKGLGFVAPFYSNLEPWKHLNVDEPGLYAATDALQTIRIMLGLKKDLQKSGQWDSFMKYATRLDHQALYPMEKIGIKVERPTLLSMQATIATSIEAIEDMIANQVPDAALPWDGGWKRKPQFEGAFSAKVKERVIVCRLCSAIDVTEKHLCKETETAP